VRNGVYFVTVRCADSLPTEVVDRLRAVHATLATIEPSSSQFVALQRQYFLSMEKHLDGGFGQCRLADSRAAGVVVAELHALAEWHVKVPHYSIMPNHWHALLEPRPDCTRALGEIMRRVKGRTARTINAVFGSAGAFWQREWFDRWMRNEGERERCVRYIQNNPVKAGITREVGEHPWTR
jgi:REP element-mobilizing transposase RayT